MNMNYKLIKYQDIATIIIEKIKNNEFPPGSRIPSENEIIKNYDVSNTTARKVLQVIENGGWATKIQGIGTIVNDFTVGRTVSKILSFTRNMKEMGLVPSTQLIESTILKTDFTVKVGGEKILINKPVFRIRRLRLANNIPMMHETRYISMTLCPHIEELNLEESLYSIYKESYNLNITRIDQVLNAIILNDYYRNLFNTKSILPGIRVNGITFCEENKVLEAEESTYRGDRYRFMVQALP